MGCHSVLCHVASARNGAAVDVDCQNQPHQNNTFFHNDKIPFLSKMIDFYFQRTHAGSYKFAESILQIELRSMIKISVVFIWKTFCFSIHSSGWCLAHPHDQQSLAFFSVLSQNNLKISKMRWFATWCLRGSYFLSSHNDLK